MSIQLILPRPSLWGDQLGMLISWKQCPQWSIQHSSVHDMFNMWSIQWVSRGIFLNSLDSKLCWEHSIIHYRTLVFCCLNLHQIWMDWDDILHARCLPQATHTLAHIYLCIDIIQEEGRDFMWSSSAVSQASDGRAELNHVQHVLVTPHSSSLLIYPQASILHPVTFGHFSLCHMLYCSILHTVYTEHSPCPKN